MDGAVVRAISTASATTSTPVRLAVAGVVDAGTIWQGDHSRAEALLIGTGAAIPEGFDAVIPIEALREVGDSILISAPIEPGSNIRPQGEDIRHGARALPQGAALRAQEIALLAALGIDRVKVRQKAAVSILSTGLELFAPSDTLRVHDANGPMLSALVTAAGGEVVGAAQSDGLLEDLFDHFDEWGDTSDFVITSGGISNSLADTMTDMLENHPRAELWDVRLRPGKHFGFAWFEDFIVLALPGNPIAAMVGFELFGRPIIERLGGKSISPLGPHARATDPIQGKLGRTDAFRGHAWLDGTGQLLAAPTENRGSGVLSSLPDANCLLLLPEETESTAPGDLVQIHWLGYQ